MGTSATSATSTTTARPQPPPSAPRRASHAAASWQRASRSFTDCSITKFRDAFVVYCHSCSQEVSPAYLDIDDAKIAAWITLSRGRYPTCASTPRRSPATTVGDNVSEASLACKQKLTLLHAVGPAGPTLVDAASLRRT